MKNKNIQFLSFLLIMSFLCSCNNYELCSETPAVDAVFAFRVVDENGVDLGYNGTFVYPITSLSNGGSGELISYFYKDEATQQGLFYIETFKNLTPFNSSEYILRYNFSNIDTIRINAEWTQNACDVEYSKINSISRGSTEFEQVDNVFLIVKD